MKVRLLLLAAVAVGLLAPAAPAAAAVSYEVHYVPSVGGALMRVEVQRDTRVRRRRPGRPADVLAVQHAERDRSRPTMARVGPYNRIGIARAVADVIGTRGSTGCWDYGGADEQQSGVDVVQFLAARSDRTAARGPTATSA